MIELSAPSFAAVTRRKSAEDEGVTRSISSSDCFANAGFTSPVEGDTTMPMASLASRA